MARVLPFPALLPAIGSASRPPAPGASAATLSADQLRALKDSVQPDAALARFQAEGAVLRDARPGLYLLEVQREHGWRASAPVRFLLCALPPDGSSPLEQEARQPRSSLIDPAVTLAADDHGALRALLAEAAERSHVFWQGGDAETVLTLRRIEPPSLSKRVQAVLAEAPLRSLSALDERKPSLAAVVPLSDPGLALEPIHRGIKGVETFREETFLTLVGAYARIYDVADPLTSSRGLAAAQERLSTLISGHHAVLLVLPGGRGKILRFRQGLDLAHLKGAPRNPTLRSLDLALLNSLILRTVLGVADPEAASHRQVFTVHSLDELVASVESGTFQAGFALNPPPLWEVRAVIEAGATLPSRTLRVAPNPPSGLLFLDPTA